MIARDIWTKNKNTQCNIMSSTGRPKKKCLFSPLNSGKNGCFFWDALYIIPNYFNTVKIPNSAFTRSLGPFLRLSRPVIYRSLSRDPVSCSTSSIFSLLTFLSFPDEKNTIVTNEESLNSVRYSKYIKLRGGRSL